MLKEKVLEHIIEGYRDAIYHRYQFQNIQSKYEIPVSVTQETVDELRAYFLDYMYPPFEKRAFLNEAFNSLDEYTKNPKKLGRILIDASRILFKHGRRLPKILSAGLQAMKTFKAAMAFENNLVDKAITHDMEAPYTLAKMDTLIGLLSRNEIENFIDSSQALFQVIHDKVLMKKIKTVIEHIIYVMKKNPASYSLSQSRGLEIGLEMITKGDALFNRLSKEDQKQLIGLITQIERNHLDQIF